MVFFHDVQKELQEKSRTIFSAVQQQAKMLRINFFLIVKRHFQINYYDLVNVVNATNVFAKKLITVIGAVIWNGILNYTRAKIKQSNQSYSKNTKKWYLNKYLEWQWTFLWRSSMEQCFVWSHSVILAEMFLKIQAEGQCSPTVARMWAIHTKNSLARQYSSGHENISCQQTRCLLQAKLPLPRLGQGYHTHTNTHTPLNPLATYMTLSY